MQMVHILTYKPNTDTSTVMSTSHKEKPVSILCTLFLGPLFRLKVEQGRAGRTVIGAGCDASRGHDKNVVKLD